VEAQRKREEEDQRAKELIEAILLEHPEYGYRRIEQELRRRGIVFNHKRIQRLLQDFQLSLRRTAKKPKPNPLLQTVLLAGEKADLRASLLREGEPEAFALLYTDFSLVSYAGGKGKAWFTAAARSWPGGSAPPPRRSWPWRSGGGPKPPSSKTWASCPQASSTMTRGVPS
jgi:putative transposase